MSSSRQYTAIIFDLGDVLIRWSSKTKTSISSTTLHAILSSPIWFDYERGRLSEDDCYASVGAAFRLEPHEIRRAFDQARDSLEADDRLISLIRELKARADGQLRVFAMSNISLPDYAVLRTKAADWSIFDQIFTSGAAGERKPDLSFYKHVLKKTNLDPVRTIFIDDRLENILSARTLGLHGIVFDTSEAVERALRNLFGDPLKRGREFLLKNAGHLYSVMDRGEKEDFMELHENFTQLLILEATNDRTLVDLEEHPTTWNFFQGTEQLAMEDFPFDVDTTSLGLTILRREKQLISSILDEVVQYVDTDGVILEHSDDKRPRLDPVVCVNALSLFYAYGRGNELNRTLRWVQQVLQNKAYLPGTRYYQTPECFLFFISRLLASSGDPDLHATLKSLLKERAQERIGAKGDALALAMRILACDSVGIRNETDLRTLLLLQCNDGGWEASWIYKYGSSGVPIGNRGLATALAIKAIEAMGPLPITLSQPGLPPAIESSSSQKTGRMTVGHRYLRNSLNWLHRKSVDII